MARFCFALAVLSLLCSPPARATVLTFDGITPVINGTAIPAGYGDRVNAVLDPGTGYQYGNGNGFTPNVVVEYTLATNPFPFSLWTTGYGQCARPRPGLRSR